MARIVKVKNDNGKEIKFYLNENDVGRGARGNPKRTDVQLVQFFLAEFYRVHPGLFTRLGKTKTPGSTVDIDGVFGRQTIDGIWVFQDFQKQGRIPILVDGRVTAPAGRNVVVPGLRTTMYTIYRLNDWFFRHGDNMKFNEELYMHPVILARAPALASELAQDDLYS
jgi:hypothetical protein